MNMTSLASQLSLMLESLLSLHFLFLAGMGVLLTQKKLSEKQYNILMFLGIFTYFLLFYGKYIHIFTMAGDNICQIAYWKILFHPNLTGSIGASYTKPGQLFVLGLLYELSGLFGESAFRIGLCMIMAGCVWSLSRIATDIGGREAGAVAFLAASWVFLPEFLAGSYSIFLIPTLYAGLWLYYYNPGRKTVGRLLLVLSIQFHIQTVTVLAVVWLLLLVNREWKELATFSIAAIGSLTAWILVILRVQGAIDRINSGVAAGYVAPFGEAFAYDNKLDYIFKAITTELTSNYTIILLLILAATGIAGSCYHRCKAYLSVFSVIIILILNVVMLNGTINLGRYFSLVHGFSCSVGTAAMVLFAARINRKLPPLIAAITLIPFVILMHAASTNADRRQSSLPDYVTNASTLLVDRNLPFATRLMTEDDLLYPIVVLSPDRYRSLTALQYFNVADTTKRRQILSRTDYIWIVTNHGHPYYYLDHTPLPGWRADEFRLMIHDMLHDGQPKTLYGFRFTPIAVNAEHLLLMVKSDIMT